MEWILLFVAVFQGSITAFVAIPRSALLRVADPLGGGIAQVGDPTSGS